MKTLKIHLLFCLLFLFTLSIFSCDFFDSKLNVWNNSSDSLAFTISTEFEYYPATSPESFRLMNGKDSLPKLQLKYDTLSEHHNGVYFIGNGSKRNLRQFNTTWEGVIERTPNKKLEIYFFPASVFTSGKYTWKQIWHNKLYLDKKEFTEDELSRLNWNIYYGK